MSAAALREGRRAWPRRVLLAAAGLFLGAGLYLANANWVAGDPLPMPFGVGIATVTSGSMEPALHVGDLVVVREAGDVAQGDVIVFQSGRRLVVHRVEQVDGDVLVTRGDANAVDDEPIRMGDVRGKVVLSVPAVGGAASALRSPLAMAVVLVAAVVLAERSRRAGDRQDERELDAMREEIELLRGQVGDPVHTPASDLPAGSDAEPTNDDEEEGR